MARANVEIDVARRQHAERKTAHLRARLPITLIDLMLNELEDLNLRKVERVPDWYLGRLGEIRNLIEGIPAISGHLADVKVRVKVVRLMDTLYDIQEELFASLQPPGFPGQTDTEDLLAG